ncbi:MAG: YihY/virulence factor BrkB family protein [Rubrivivax sp.]|nr:YihY/virulence factor BrkB family protein [Rubrivivax sp.]
MINAAWRLIRDAAVSWVDDYAPSMGAALAFYTLFSIAPLLLIVISVAGLVFGEQAARGEIFGQLATLLGPESAKTIEVMLQALNKPDAGVLGTLVGLIVLLIGATTVFAELQDAMDRIWRAPTRPAGGGLWRLLRTRLLSLGLVLGIGFLLIVSLVASAGLAALGKWWEPWFSDVAFIARTLELGLSFGFITVVFAMIYKWMPRVRVAWRDVWVGAALTALLFTAGKTLIGFYIGRSGVASPFGAAASLVVLLLWVYYSAQIFLLGAEFTWVYARRYGSLRGFDAPPLAVLAQPAPGEDVLPPVPAPPVPHRPGFKLG